MANNESDVHTDLPPLFTTDASSRTEDFGVFTSQRFGLTDRDNLDLGVRYSKVTVNALTAGTKNTYEATTGNASYQHEFTQDLMAYASYGMSFRPGSGNSRAAPQAAIPASFGNFDDEESKTWEVGIKSQWFERRLTANVSYFDQTSAKAMNSSCERW